MGFTLKKNKITKFKNLSYDALNIRKIKHIKICFNEKIIKNNCNKIVFEHKKWFINSVVYQ